MAIPDLNAVISVANSRWQLYLDRWEKASRMSRITSYPPVIIRPSRSFSNAYYGIPQRVFYNQSPCQRSSIICSPTTPCIFVTGHDMCISTTSNAAWSTRQDQVPVGGVGIYASGGGLVRGFIRSSLLGRDDRPSHIFGTSWDVHSTLSSSNSHIYTENADR